MKLYDSNSPKKTMHKFIVSAKNHTFAPAQMRNLLEDPNIDVIKHMSRLLNGPTACDVMILFPPPSCFLLPEKCWANGIGDVLEDFKKNPSTIFEFRKLFPPENLKNTSSLNKEKHQEKHRPKPCPVPSQFSSQSFCFKPKATKGTKYFPSTNLFHGCNLPITIFFQGQRQAVLEFLSLSHLRPDPPRSGVPDEQVTEQPTKATKEITSKVFV